MNVDFRTGAVLEGSTDLVTAEIYQRRSHMRVLFDEKLHEPNGALDMVWILPDRDKLASTGAADLFRLLACIEAGGCVGVFAKDPKDAAVAISHLGTFADGNGHA